MALISIRNIVAPFENKTHLFTIVVIAIIFGVWRASGGSLTSQPVSSPGNRIESRATTEEPRFQPLKSLSNRTPGGSNSTLPTSKPTVSRTTSSNSRDELDSLLAPQKQSVHPNSPEKHHSALDDIEKSLGMR